MALREMRLVELTLTILIALTFLAFITGSSWVTADAIENQTLEVVINGSTSTVEIYGEDILFTIDYADGLITTLIITAVISSAWGINVLGSGFNNEAVRILASITWYVGLWIGFSIIPYSLILSIPTFGIYIYALLTVFYAVGVILKLFGGD